MSTPLKGYNDEPPAAYFRFIRNEYYLARCSKREILLLAEPTMDPNLLRQKEILQADVAGLTERDLIVP